MTIVTDSITPEQQEQFQALTSGKYSNFALLSVTVNGEPSVAIVAMTPNADKTFDVTPLYVAVTPAMDLRDPYGEAPTT